MMKRRDRGTETVWDVERREFCQSNGLGTQEFERRMILDEKKLIREVLERDEEVQRQLQLDKIANSTFNPKYEFIRVGRRPVYLGSMSRNWKKEEVKMVARFRCGCEEMNNWYWLKEEERKGRCCGREKDQITHWIRDCTRLESTESGIRWLLDEFGNGRKWMRSVIEARGN